MRTSGNGKTKQNDKIRKQAGNRTLWCGDPAVYFFVCFCQLLSAAHGMRIVSCKLTSRKMRPMGGYAAEAAVI